MIFDERTINILESIKVPNTYWNKRSVQYLYWFRSLLQKLDSAITFENLPKEWDDDFFHICLWALGFVGVFKPDDVKQALELADFGKVVFNPGFISGYNFYYQPTTFTVSNPHLKAPFTKEFTIGENVELVKLTPDFGTTFDIIDFYASKLAELSKGIDVGLLNAKMPFIVSAKNEAQSSTVKKVYDKIQEGEGLIVWKNIADGDEIIPTKDPFEAWINDYQKTYIVSNLLEDMQTILDSFYKEIGLPVAIEKKERLITSEADFASAQSQARISCWMETLRESLEKVNRMFDLDIQAYTSYEQDQEGEEDERPDNANRN